jgi:leucyl-tRNA synthetase
MIENFALNSAIAKIREFSNKLMDLKDLKTKKDYDFVLNILKKFFCLLEPFVPHLAQYFWERIGCDGLIYNEKWPEIEKLSESCVEKGCKISVLIKGKNFGILNVEEGENEKEIHQKALELLKNLPKLNEEEKKSLEGVKYVYVKGKIINFV